MNVSKVLLFVSLGVGLFVTILTSVEGKVLSQQFVGNLYIIMQAYFYCNNGVFCLLLQQWCILLIIATMVYFAYYCNDGVFIAYNQQTLAVSLSS